MATDDAGSPIDQDDIRSQVTSSIRRLRQMLSELDVLVSDLGELHQQAREVRDQLDTQLKELQASQHQLGRGSEPTAWARAAYLAGISLEHEMQLAELGHVIGSKDLLFRRECAMCGRSFLARKSTRKRLYCGTVCRVRAHRKRGHTGTSGGANRES